MAGRSKSPVVPFKRLILGVVLRGGRSMVPDTGPPTFWRSRLCATLVNDSSKRGYTREAAIRPNKPSTFAGEFPFSVLALVLSYRSECLPSFPIGTGRKTSGSAHLGKSRGSKSRKLTRNKAHPSSDPRILTWKCCDRFRSVDCLLGLIAASLV